MELVPFLIFNAVVAIASSIITANYMVAHSALAKRAEQQHEALLRAITLLKKHYPREVILHEVLDFSRRHDDPKGKQNGPPDQLP